MTKFKLSKLIELESKSAKGPWIQWIESGDISSRSENCFILQSLFTKITSEGHTGVTEQGLDDIAFIIYFKNHFQEIVSALRKTL